LGIALVGSGLIALGTALLFLEDSWKSGQAPTADSIAIDRLISWRANPNFLNRAEISELSHIILQKSDQYQISPMLVLSVIEVESSYRKAAVSDRGAVGLMQLMPETAQEIALSSGMKWNGPAILEDPKSNIEFGLKYLVYLKRQFSHPEHILTAYNIGPNALKKKLQDRRQKLPLDYYNRVMGTVKAYQNRAHSNRARPGLWVNSWL